MSTAFEEVNHPAIKFTVLVRVSALQHYTERGL